MIEITLKISDKENGTPGEVCELIENSIENISGSDGHFGRLSIEYAKARKV